jgi:hypothetical protein
MDIMHVCMCMINLQMRIIQYMGRIVLDIIDRTIPERRCVPERRCD